MLNMECIASRERRLDHLAGKYLVFDLQSKHFAIPLSLVSEITRSTAFTPVPCSHASLLGIFNLRGIIVPLTDLRQIFSLSDGSGHDDTSRGRFLVIRQGESVQAVRVDGVLGIFLFENGEIGEVPAAFRGISGSYLLGFVDIKNGMREILLLNMAKVLKIEADKPVLQMPFWNDGYSDSSSPGSVVLRPSLSILTFLVGRMEFAVELNAVCELIRIAGWEAVPSAPAYVTGVMVHREMPVFLIDLCDLFGITGTRQPVRDAGSRRRLALILKVDDVAVGLLADDVVEIMDTDEDRLQQDPMALSAFGKEIRAVIELDFGRRIIMLLDQPFFLSRIDLPFLMQSEQRIRGETLVDISTENRQVSVKKLLLFSLLSDFHALPVEIVREIVALGNLTPLPDSDPFIAGFTNIRGVVYVVVDMKHCLGFHSFDEEVKRIVAQVKRLSGEESTKGSGLSSADGLQEILLERIRNKRLGARACGQLLDDLAGKQEIMDSAFEEFERALEVEVIKLRDFPKLLVLTGSVPVVFMVDSVRSVVEVKEDSIEWHAGDHSADHFEANISGSFIRPETGDRIRIPDFKGIVEKQRRVLTT